MTANILVPSVVYVILLPHRLHHLAGQPAGDFTPMKSVVRAIAITRRRQLEPPLGKLIIYTIQWDTVSIHGLKLINVLVNVQCHFLPV